MSSQGTRARCVATTKAGQPCKNSAVLDSAYCRVHSATVAISAPPMTPQTPDVEVEPRPAELRKQLVQELDRLIRRLRAVSPETLPFSAPPDSLRGVLLENLGQIVPGASALALQGLRNVLDSDALDIETWKGLWFVVNYMVQNQTNAIRQRLRGEYETDEWGLDAGFREAVQPFLDFLYRRYWRIQATGIEHVPAEGRGLIAANHSGQLPWDTFMVATALYSEHPQKRMLRTLYAPSLPTLPFASAIANKLGQTLATLENGARLLNQDQLVAVYPEGDQGMGKLYRERYKLAPFGRGDFVKMALSAGAPIIPTAIVGAEETYISLHKSRTLARLTGLPYFPISPTFPWLGLGGLIPLPTKWCIDFGEPIPTAAYGPASADNPALVAQLADQVRAVIQEMVQARLAQRKSVFRG